MRYFRPIMIRPCIFRHAMIRLYRDKGTVGEHQTDRQTVHSGLAPAPPTTFSRAAPPGLTRLTVRVVTQLRARPASYACPSASSKSEAYTAQDDG